LRLLALRQLAAAGAPVRSRIPVRSRTSPERCRRRRPTARTRLLSPRSQVRTGDIVSTERDSHAQINFSDGAQVTLKPSSSFRIDNFGFTKDRPKEDSFITSVLTGGLRIVTGLVGSRSRSKFSMGTATRPSASAARRSARMIASRVSAPA
jgi:hypothetical protein